MITLISPLKFTSIMPILGSNITRAASTMAAPTAYDIIFLGSGQSANILAKDFARAGRTTCLVERSSLGGTCVNVGCTPTKTMIASGRAAYMAQRGADYGVHTGKIEVDMVKVRERKRAIVEQWHSGSVKGLEGAGVKVLMGEARFVGMKKVAVQMNDGNEVQITAETIFISAGERAAKPEIDGIENVDEQRVVDSTSIMELDSVPKHLVVLGGGYIGLEFGQLFRRLGAEVTIVQRAKQLVPKEDFDIADCLREILEEDGIKVHLFTIVKSISKNNEPSTPFTVNVHTPTGPMSIPGSYLLLATGRKPNTDLLKVSATGVNKGPKGHVLVDEKLRTNIPGIYAIGDIHGGPAFTHMSYDDARIIRNNLLAGSLEMTTPLRSTTRSSRSRVLAPYVMYTDPQLGHFGLHKRDLEGRITKTAVMPMSAVARALETAEPRGMMKATVDAETGEVIGFTCLGLEGGEIMSLVQTAAMGGLKWWDLQAAVWAHPTLAESLNNLWTYLK